MFENKTTRQKARLVAALLTAGVELKEHLNSMSKSDGARDGITELISSIEDELRFCLMDDVQCGQ